MSGSGSPAIPDRAFPSTHGRSPGRAGTDEILSRQRPGPLGQGVLSLAPRGLEACVPVLPLLPAGTLTLQDAPSFSQRDNDQRGRKRRSIYDEKLALRAPVQRFVGQRRHSLPPVLPSKATLS